MWVGHEWVGFQVSRRNVSAGLLVDSAGNTQATKSKPIARHQQLNLGALETQLGRIANPFVGHQKPICCVPKTHSSSTRNTLTAIGQDMAAVRRYNALQPPNVCSRSDGQLGRAPHQPAPRDYPSGHASRSPCGPSTAFCPWLNAQGRSHQRNLLPVDAAGYGVEADSSVVATTPSVAVTGRSLALLALPLVTHPYTMN